MDVSEQTERFVHSPMASCSTDEEYAEPYQHCVGARVLLWVSSAHAWCRAVVVRQGYAQRDHVHGSGTKITHSDYQVLLLRNMTLMHGLGTSLHAYEGIDAAAGVPPLRALCLEALVEVGTWSLSPDAQALIAMLTGDLPAVDEFCSSRQLEDLIERPFDFGVPGAWKKPPLMAALETDQEAVLRRLLRDAPTGIQVMGLPGEDEPIRSLLCVACERTTQRAQRC